MIQIEHKNILCALKENSRGRFLRLTEKVGADFHCLIIPSTGLEDLRKLLDRMIQASNEQPFPFNPVTQMQPQALANGRILKSVMIQIERKSFMLTLKEGPRGRHLRLTEKTVDRFTCLNIQSSELEEFQKLLGEMVRASNELPSAFNPGAQSGPPFKEDTIKSGQMQIEDKTFVFLLRENARGRFLRLIEDSPGHYPSNLIIPSSGLEEFKKLVDDMVKMSNELPPTNLPESCQPIAFPRPAVGVE